MEKSIHVYRNLRMDFCQEYFHDVILGVYIRRTLNWKLGNIGARLGFIVFCCINLDKYLNYFEYQSHNLENGDLPCLSYEAIVKIEKIIYLKVF